MSCTMGRDVGGRIRLKTRIKRLIGIEPLNGAKQLFVLELVAAVLLFVILWTVLPHKGEPMDKYRKDLAELMAAVETQSPTIPMIISRIKSSWNNHMKFQYEEQHRRYKAAQERREAKKEAKE